MRKIPPSKLLKVFALIGLSLLLGSYLTAKSYKGSDTQILKVTIDRRPETVLYSVVYVQKSDTFALDYISRTELDSLFNLAK